MFDSPWPNTLDHESSTAPFLLFLRSDVGEKAWPQQLLLNKKGFTPNCRWASPIRAVRARIYRRRINTPFALTGSKYQAYIYACRVQRVKTVWAPNIELSEH